MSTWKKVLTTGSDISSLTDVAVTSPVQDEVLKWNGTNWVAASSGESFAFGYNTNTYSLSLASIGPSHQNLNYGSAYITELIGSGVYETGAPVLSVKFKNLSPGSDVDELADDFGYFKALVSIGGSNTTPWADNTANTKLLFDHGNANFSMSVSQLTINSETDFEEWAYPEAMGTEATYGSRYQFRVGGFKNASTGEVLGDSTYQDIRFSNYVYISKCLNADIPGTGDGDLINDQNAGTGSDHAEAGYKAITNDLGTSSNSSSKDWLSSVHSIDCGDNYHLLFMVPTRLVTSTNTLTFFDKDTGIGFDMTKGADDVTVTNERSFDEDYTVYYSTETGLGEINLTTKR